MYCVKFLRNFKEWNPLNIAQRSCAHGNDSDVTYVTSLEECKKKSEGYKYIWFPDKREESGDYKCIRQSSRGCTTVMASVPGSTYAKEGGYYLDFYLK